MKPGKIATEFVKSRMNAITALVMLLVPICLGGLAGFFLDKWLHTMPIFFLVLILCGLAAGIRSLMRFKI
ncbi:MAG: AtpZ/AtpI family protein [Caldiserica bacterium]|nr:AtpZ/AtpI family protein [Caldisericota bacterium]